MNRRQKAAAAVLGGCALSLTAEAFRSMEALRAAEYTVPLASLREEVRFVFFSDLHARSFGRDNERLLQLTTEQEPAFIALVGDFLSRWSDGEDEARVCRLTERLSRIAPVYYALGNHELSYLRRHETDFLQRMASAGAVVLRESYAEAEFPGGKLRIGAMAAPLRAGESSTCAFLDDFCATDLPRILLSHRPDALARAEDGADHPGGLARWKMELVLSGHTHGALFRPFGVGIYGPEEGLFPRLYYGEHEFYGTKLLITSGLAGARTIPRLFNPVEICTVRLCTKE